MTLAFKRWTDPLTVTWTRDDMTASRSWRTLLSLSVAGLALYIISILVYRLVFAPFFSPWKDLPTVRRTSFWWGNLRELTDPFAQKAWLEQVSGAGVLRFWEPFGKEKLLITDPRAVYAIFGPRYNNYVRPAGFQRLIKGSLGPGLVTVWGDQHRRQRRILNPAFQVKHIKALVPVFFEYASQLCDRLGEEVDEKTGEAVDSTVEVGELLVRATLNIIGMAGFGYRFDALSKGISGGSHLAHETGRSMQTAATTDRLVFVISTYIINCFSWLFWLPIPRFVEMRKARRAMGTASQEILDDKIEAILKLQGGEVGKEKISQDVFDGQLGGAAKGRDIVQNLLRAVMAEDINEKDKLRENELIGQMITFMFAGHETVSTLTTWALHFLSLDIVAQDKLRAEIQSAYSTVEDERELTYDELDALPYLDNVVQEALRMVPPVFQLLRESTKDDTIPIGVPFRSRDGKRLIDSVFVPKGTIITFSILAAHRSKAIWGDDADVFRPERWDNLPETHAQAQFPSGSPLFAFSSGPKTCIGNRFALCEAKVLLVSLLRRFRFESPSGQIVVPRQALTIRPMVVGKEDEGVAMPLIVKRMGA